MTGGQYSVARIVLGTGLLALFGSLLVLGLAAPSDVLERLRSTAPAPLYEALVAWLGQGGTLALAGLAVAAAMLLAAGLWDGLASTVLMLCLAALAFAMPKPLDPVMAGRFTILVTILAFHAWTARAPFGSWSAIGRMDPGAGWRYTPAQTRLAPLLLAAALAGAGALNLTVFTPGVPFLGWIQLGFAAGMLVPIAHVRFASWLLGLLGHLVLLFLEPTDPSHYALFAYGFAWNPAWMPARGRGRVYYDGTCGFCHGATRAILAEDTADDPRIRFAPLQGETARANDIPAAYADAGGAGTMAFQDEATGEIRIRSRAVLGVLDGLGGWWRLIGTALRVVPRPIADMLYRLVAWTRDLWAGTPSEACPALPASLRRRFDP